LLIDLAAQGLRYDLYGVTFSWCFSQAQRQPERFSVGELLFHYQDVISKLVNFPEFPRSQYELLFTEVRGLFEKYGYSLRSLYRGRRAVAQDFGDREMAREADQEWRRYPRDSMSYSFGYEVSEQINFEVFLRNDDDAARTANNWFADQGRQTFFDALIAGEALLPLFRLGRMKEAIELHKHVRRAIRPDTGFIWHWGPILSFLGLTQNLGLGVRQFEKLLPIATGQTDLLSRFHFHEHATVLFRQLSDVHKKAIRLRVSPSQPWYDAKGKYEPREILQWVDNEVDEIARRFDERNGNTCYVDLLRDQRELGDLAQSIPIR
jgi:hypothetical protein